MHEARNRRAVVTIQSLGNISTWCLRWDRARQQVTDGPSLFKQVQSRSCWNTLNLAFVTWCLLNFLSFNWIFCLQLYQSHLNIAQYLQLSLGTPPCVSDIPWLDYSQSPCLHSLRNFYLDSFTYYFFAWLPWPPDPQIEVPNPVFISLYGSELANDLKICNLPCQPKLNPSSSTFSAHHFKLNLKLPSHGLLFPP